MSATSGALSIDQIVVEVSRWLNDDRASVDWVSETDAVVSDLMTQALTLLSPGFGATLARSFRQLFPSSIDYELECDVEPPAPEPTTAVRLRLVVGSRVVGQEYVTSDWWRELGLPPTDDVKRLCRASAAAVLCMIANRRGGRPTSLHKITDPRVLFLLNEARSTDGPALRRVVNLAARLDPGNSAVQFQLLATELRGDHKTELRCDHKPDDPLLSGEELAVLERGFAQVVSETESDRTLQARAMYQQAVCAVHSKDSVAVRRGHQMLVLIHDHFLDDAALPPSFEKAFRPVIVSALAYTCRITGCPRAEHSLRLALAQAASPRAMYNLACVFAAEPGKHSGANADHPEPNRSGNTGGTNERNVVSAAATEGTWAERMALVSARPAPSISAQCQVRLETAITYLEAALRAEPALARFARTDPTLSPLKCCEPFVTRFNNAIKRAAAGEEFTVLSDGVPRVTAGGAATEHTITGTGMIDLVGEAGEDVTFAITQPSAYSTTFTLTAAASASVGLRVLKLLKLSAPQGEAEVAFKVVSAGTDTGDDEPDEVRRTTTRCDHDDADETPTTTDELPAIAPAPQSPKSRFRRWLRAFFNRERCWERSTQAVRQSRDRTPDR